MKRVVFALIFMFFSFDAFAGVCTTLVTRVCQPGKTCRTSESHTDLANTPEECLSIAKRFCPVYFTEGVATKQVRVLFDGQPLSQNLCQ